MSVYDMHRENSNNWWSWRTDACMVLSPDGRFYRATTNYEATREEGWMDKGSYRDSTDVDASGRPGLNATDASVLAWGRRAYAACVEQCGGCDATGAAVDRVPAGLDAFFEAPHPAVDRPALDDAGCFSARALRGEDWPYVTTGHWVVICVMALVLATPWVLGVCASRRCCPWYGTLQRFRNEFADACPCLARCLRLLCVSGCASCARCCGACRRRVRGCVRAPPRKASADVAPEEDDAAEAAGEAPADDVVLLEPQAEDAPEARGAGFRARGASVAGQARLVLWKIGKTKSRSPSTVLSQLVFPAAWFVVVWLLYVIMAKTFLPNHQWNKKHWNYAAKEIPARLVDVINVSRPSAAEPPDKGTRCLGQALARVRHLDKPVHLTQKDVESALLSETVKSFLAAEAKLRGTRELAREENDVWWKSASGDLRDWHDRTLFKQPPYYLICLGSVACILFLNPAVRGCIIKQSMIMQWAESNSECVCLLCREESRFLFERSSLRPPPSSFPFSGWASWSAASRRRAPWRPSCSR